MMEMKGLGLLRDGRMLANLLHILTFFFSFSEISSDYNAEFLFHFLVAGLKGLIL